MQALGIFDLKNSFFLNILLSVSRQVMNNYIIFCSDNNQSENNTLIIFKLIRLI